MKLPMSVDVTQEDILNGIEGDPKKCPVALAIRRAAGIRYVRVFGSYAYVKKKFLGVFVTDFLKLKMPSSVINFTLTFDRFGCGAPFTFCIEDHCV